TSAFRFNDAVLRHLTIKRDGPIVEPSLMAKAKDEHDERESERRSRHQATPSTEDASPAEPAVIAEVTE
ncbi:MAG: 30S ribosomal protein S6, partial [Gammaproteobacteria bacterium]